MDFDALTGGVEPGGLRVKNDCMVNKNHINLKENSHHSIMENKERFRKEG